MLEIETLEDEIYMPSLNRFIYVPASKFIIEHSLISLAKWESKWHIPYLSNAQRTTAQELDYIRCMTIGTPPGDYVIELLSPINIKKIKDYIDNPMTATTFSRAEKSSGLRKEVITAETVYARMFDHNISMECQKWHLNRLLTLIKVCDLQNAPRKKMNKKQTAMWNAEQNAARRAKYNTRG